MMTAATALAVRMLADEQLTFDQKRRLASELALLGRISKRSKPDAVCGTAVQDAVMRVREEMRRDPTVLEAEGGSLGSEAS